MSILGHKTTTLLPAHVRPRRKAIFFSMEKTSSLTLALLAVIVVVACSGIVAAVKGAPLRNQYVVWSACGMLVGLATTILLIGRIVTHRSLAVVERHLRDLSRSGTLTTLDHSMPGELQPVMDALSAYVLHVHTRMDELRLQKKELDIQMRLAEADRQSIEAIIISISDAVLVIDSYGELILANTAAEQLLGFHARQWRHRPVERVLEDATLVSLLKDARSPDEQSGRRQVEYTVLRDGRTQTFNITLSRVTDAAGHPRGVVAVFHDITREKEIAQIKSDFVSVVSHELRTPLSSIKAYVEMLVDGEAHDENTRRHFYQIIETETNRLQRLINNILNISKIESGVVEVHYRSLQVNEVVGEVAAMMMPQARDKNITVETDLDENLPAIRADRDMVHQAVLNLASNAVKYTPSGGCVRFITSTDENGRHVAITVRDNGMGIKTQDLPRIFDKFYRGQDGASTASGTGLGLSLVKQIVETVHKGEISVASEPGAGTTIVLRFPLLTD
ncbi:MAG TPA: ATP-binding protein [Phycisphaerae bacterium]|nr:ATP-binding protein [Phycisphaerae bacterium]